LALRKVDRYVVCLGDQGYLEDSGFVALFAIDSRGSAVEKDRVDEEG
jgi:hypothetical protein